MDEIVKKRTEDFLCIADDFKLGKLVTESSHPATARLSNTADQNISEALKLLFKVDDDVVSAYKKWSESELPMKVSQTVADTIRAGGKIFFTGCGATGRLSIQLDAIWREFWQNSNSPNASELADHTISIMAGGDYALIKSVEGFEDFTQFGAKQISDMGVSSKDIVFAITEGGETSFVIGTAWQGVETGAKVYFVYNNPDHILREYVDRSREIIDCNEIEKINLTTGPMAIMGSTRMQATSIQLCVMITILEMVICNLIGNHDMSAIPARFLKSLEGIHNDLVSSGILSQLSSLVSTEENTYRRGNKTGYFADQLGIDVLTDTTERSPTFCVPAFRKFDDRDASDSWAFLYTLNDDSREAWNRLLKRTPRCLDWRYEQIQRFVPSEMAERQCSVMKQIGINELYRFKIGLDGISYRPWINGDSAFFILSDADTSKIDVILRVMNDLHQKAIAINMIYIGSDEYFDNLKLCIDSNRILCSSIFIDIKEEFLLKGITHITAKMLLNAHSTCVMVKLGRVMGNCMVTVVPSNLKLIDRSIRYVRDLTGLSYEEACFELFKSIEYIDPRMREGKAYPPVVKLTVLRYKNKITSEEAESMII